MIILFTINFNGYYAIEFQVFVVKVAVGVLFGEFSCPNQFLQTFKPPFAVKFIFRCPGFRMVDNKSCAFCFCNTACNYQNTNTYRPVL